MEGMAVQPYGARKWAETNEATKCQRVSYTGELGVTFRWEGRSKGVELPTARRGWPWGLAGHDGAHL